MRLTQEKFEQLVNKGIAAVPKKFLKKLDNVAIVIEDLPSPQQKKELKLRSDYSLFGLYHGIPQVSRGNNYSGVLPDKITIFKKSIEEHASSEEEVAAIVKNTVWHEIAHHFGMDEGRVSRAERKRKK